MTQVRVRFAPSPTGPFHIGGARTALYNWLFARHHGGTFILRIDDTDAARSTQVSLQQIFDSLTWLGLGWDEGPNKGGDCGPYFQSQKFERYQQVGAQLLHSGHAYRCFCTEAEIDAGRKALEAAGGKPMYDRRCRALDPAQAQRRLQAGEKWALRFAIPDGTRVMDDMVKGKVELGLAELDDWVMLRNDGSPLYNFCSTVDDIDHQITHVIRGEEHFYNGFKQILLFEALGATPPRFAHLPLILGKDGKKISKRLAQTNLLDFKDQGYPPEAIVNFVVLLGWAYDDKQQVFTRQELIEKFTLDKISPGGSMFDEDKLAWMSGVYLRAMSKDAFLDRATPFLAKHGFADAERIARHRAWFRNAVACEQERVTFLDELKAKLPYLFAERLDLDEGARANLQKEPRSKELAAAYRDSIQGLVLPPSDPAARGAIDEQVVLPTTATSPRPAATGFQFLPPWVIEEQARALAERLGVKFGALVHPLRALLTGTTKGPGLFDVVFLLGKEKVMARLSAPF